MIHDLYSRLDIETRDNYRNYETFSDHGYFTHWHANKKWNIPYFVSHSCLIFIWSCPLPILLPPHLTDFLPCPAPNIMSEFRCITLVLLRNILLMILNKNDFAFKLQLTFSVLTTDTRLLKANQCQVKIMKIIEIIYRQQQISLRSKY